MLYVTYIAENLGRGRTPFTPAISILLEVVANLLRQDREGNGLPVGEEKKQTPAHRSYDCPHRNILETV